MMLNRREAVIVELCDAVLAYAVSANNFELVMRAAHLKFRITGHLELPYA